MAERGDSKLTAVHLNKEAMAALEAVKQSFEAKLAEQGIPLELSRAQVVSMALKNELARREVDVQAGRNERRGQDRDDTRQPALEHRSEPR